MTVKLKNGQNGLIAVRPAEVEPKREEGESLKRQRMEELPVQILRKRSRATLQHAKVIFPITTMTCCAHSLMPTFRQMRSLIFANGLTGLLVTSSATRRESFKGAGKGRKETPKDNVGRNLMQVCQSPQKKRSVMLTINAQVSKQPSM